jgi:nucleoside-diphosphate-sugar epimerase
MYATNTEQRALHVIVGAGPIGRGVARILVERGDRVRLVSRSGSGPDVAGAERVAADAADAEAMADLCEGAAAIYNCANPPYHRWPIEWPPIAASLLGATERSGAVLVTVSNLYGYGPARAALGVDAYDETHPMREATPLAALGRKGSVRAQMWRDALAAHAAGRIRAVEVRSSDYVGPGAESVLGERVVPRLLAGKGAFVLGRTDRLHTWTFTEDVARMAVVAGSDPRAWGHPWHTPSNAPRTQQQAADDLARVAGVPPVRLRSLPALALRGLGLASPLLRELRETEYQFRDAFVMDSAAARTTFGLEPTAWDAVLAATLRSYGWTDAGRLDADVAPAPAGLRPAEG